MHRVDHWFQRVLFEQQGARALDYWQTLPFYDLSGVSAEHFTGGDAGDLFDHLPFPEFVVYLGPDDSGEDQGLVHMLDDGDIVRLTQSMPGFAMTGVYEIDKASKQIRPDARTASFARDAATRGGRDPDAFVGDIAIEAAGVAISALKLITRTERYVVEVRPREESKQRPKPWTRTDLPRLILLTPHEAKRYQSSGDGEHAAPRLHQRRGHWRELVSERFKERRRVWVRPAWVGAREWEYKGATYRVVLDEA